MFSVARFQSKTNEKLICLLEHLSIDVFKLRLGLYGWNPRIHQAPVCDMCQNERFSVTENRQICTCHAYIKTANVTIATFSLHTKMKHDAKMVA